MFRPRRRGLRERGYYDTAIDYLNQLGARQNLPAEIREAIPYEKAITLLESSRVSRTLLSGLVDGRPPEAQSGLDALSPRQREILQLIAEGKSTKEIAFALNVSVKTIETHRAAVMDRLGIRDVAGLVVFAVRHKLISVDRADEP